MRLKIHSAVRVWFAISRQVTRDTWVRGIGKRCTSYFGVLGSRAYLLSGRRPTHRASVIGYGDSGNRTNRSYCERKRDGDICVFGERQAQYQSVWAEYPDNREEQR